MYASPSAATLARRNATETRFAVTTHMENDVATLDDLGLLTS